MMNIGINSPMISEFGGPINSREVDIIELDMARLDILNENIDYELLEELASLDTNFSIHAPYASVENKNIRVDLGNKRRRNIKVMEKVFEIASYLNAEYVVIHGGNANGDTRTSFLNTISNLKDLSEMAKDYSVTLLLENLHKENGGDKIGILPHELKQIIESIARDNLKIVLDIGHAFITSILYKFDFFCYFNMLSEYIYHIHIHDNLGIPATIDPQYGDQHLPLGHGRIDFNRIFEGIEKTKAKNLVLELKTKSEADAKESIAILKRLNRNLPRSRSFEVAPTSFVKNGAFTYGL